MLRSPCANNLSTLSCCHLPSLTKEALAIMVKGEELDQLDMRGVFPRDRYSVPKEVTRGVLKLAIFEPHEQLPYGSKEVRFCIL